MQRIISSGPLLTLLAIGLSGCGTLLPDSSISVNGSVSWSDVRDIERLLPIVGIDRPISSISHPDAETYFVDCRGRDFNEFQYETISFTAYHRNGCWSADKSSVHRSVGVMVE